MSGQDLDTLIHDWSQAGPRRPPAPRPVQVDDETLRDGLQSPSVLDPSVETKVRLLHLMDELGIETADIGLPAAGPRHFEAVLQLAREKTREGLRLDMNCAGRTLVADVEPMVRVSQQAGLRLEAALFIGSSPIRIYAEDWEEATMRRNIRESISFAVAEGLDVNFVTEDTVRSSPGILVPLLEEALQAGARRVCLCDTCGAGTPEGAYNLVHWVRAWLDGNGHGEVGIDWHGHRDRDLALANSLAAVQAGADRVHGTALGVGERVGNTPMEALLVNLKLLGMREGPLEALPAYARLAARAVGRSVPDNAPVVGRDAFRTTTGVHAAAVAKALAKGRVELADRVYSGVPAHWVGRTQEVEIGPMSGASNVRFWLEERGIEADEALVREILRHAKRLPHLLHEDEILRMVARSRRLAERGTVD